MSNCNHEGWGQYGGETGPCPPPAELRPINGGVECSICGFRIQTLTTTEAETRFWAQRETATLDREIR